MAQIKKKSVQKWPKHDIGNLRVHCLIFTIKSSNLCLNISHFKIVNFKFWLNWPIRLDINTLTLLSAAVMYALLCKLNSYSIYSHFHEYPPNITYFSCKIHTESYDKNISFLLYQTDSISNKLENRKKNRTNFFFNYQSYYLCFSEIDRDGDGRVSYRDFEYMMRYSTEDVLWYQPMLFTPPGSSSSRI